MPSSTGGQPTWCPGCGHYAVLAALRKALANLEIESYRTAIVSGIGCSGRITNYIKGYGFHVVHGRALPVATGIKLANQELTVIAAGGDGDAFAIGMSHFIHAVRRNPDITYVVMDNHIYGLTKGQASPTSEQGQKTKAQPIGNVERPVNPLQLALSTGATYVAQGFSGSVGQLTHLIQEGLRHRGFSFVNVLSPCVTFGRKNDVRLYRQALVDLGNAVGYESRSRSAAMQRIEEYGSLVTGLVYKEDESPALDDALPGYDSVPLVRKGRPLSADEMLPLLAGFQ